MGKLSIAVGSDHAGFVYKSKLIKHLIALGHVVTDLGAFSDASVDYPDFAHAVAKSVDSNEADFGILLCGSGNGVAITANKHQSIRAALCWKTELAVLARQHNNANILCIPARFVSYAMTKNMTDAFLSEKFEGGRHLRRVKKISC